MPGYIWSLDQNHPNPFNPVTTISFTLAADSQVRLEVYSIRGRRIRSLLNESRGAGPHKVIWDGRDSSGRQVASGTYFARIVSDQGTLTKKMMLMK
jgi:flagellar hook assembly protein FlgD